MLPAGYHFDFFFSFFAFSSFITTSYTVTSTGYFWKLRQWSWASSRLPFGLSRLLRIISPGWRLSFGIWWKLTYDEVSTCEWRNDSASGIDYECALGPGEIRVLVPLQGSGEEPLHCRLSAHRLSEKPYYEALSYFWGRQYDSLIYNTDVNTEPGKITRNLWEALQALRLPDAPRYLWVDAICINQQDSEEKGCQVRMMDQIYGSASEVHVWLGAADEVSHFGTVAINYFADQAAPPTDAPWYSKDSHLYAEGLSALLKRPWFSRIWTVQEAALARKVTLICGTNKVSWFTDLESLKRLKYKIKLAATSPQWGESPLRSVDLSPLLEVVEAQLREVADIGGIRLENNLLDVVYEFRNRQATDPRDKIYAMFNLAEGRRVQLDHAGDYTETREEAWERLARAINSLDPAMKIQTVI